jgi:signal transduction histidine kinase
VTVKDTTISFYEDGSDADTLLDRAGSASSGIAAAALRQQVTYRGGTANSDIITGLSVRQKSIFLGNLQDEKLDFSQTYKSDGVTVKDTTISFYEDGSVDRAKTEFVSLASHQLRTPLSAIRWYSEMLLSKYVGELNEKQRQYVKEIYTGNLRMVELVNALLNVSRIDLGTFASEPEDVNLVEVCESVLSELAPQIIQKKQTVERIFSGAPVVYSADPKLIRIVFQNFLSNSVKYTPPEGHIVAEIGVREGSLYIRVSDSGYGIPKAQHGKIFEKLFRADNVRQKDTEGTGLGMYIVKAIIESSGGKIWFDSEENKGTAFSVLLPLSGMVKKSGFKGLS